MFFVVLCPAAPKFSTGKGSIFMLHEVKMAQFLWQANYTDVKKKASSKSKRDYLLDWSDLSFEF